MTRLEKLELKFERHWAEYQRLAKMQSCPIERALYHYRLAQHFLGTLRIAEEEEAAVTEAERIVEGGQRDYLSR